jgi:hypothetical protein
MAQDDKKRVQDDKKRVQDDKTGGLSSGRSSPDDKTGGLSLGRSSQDDKKGHRITRFGFLLRSIVHHCRQRTGSVPIGSVPIINTNRDYWLKLYYINIIVGLKTHLEPVNPELEGPCKQYYSHLRFCAKITIISLNQGARRRKFYEGRSQ